MLVSKRSEFIQGAKDTFPMLVGATPFAIIFGSLAITSGLSIAATVGMSLFVFAGASQFVAVSLVATKASLLIILLTTFVVNFRHILYSATLLPKLSHLSRFWKIVLAFGLTDESFATAIKRFSNEDTGKNTEWYLLGSTLAMYLNWNFWTAIGIFAGKLIPNLESYGFDFAMLATFVGIVIPLIKDRPMLVATMTAGASSLIFRNFPYNTGLLISCFLGILAGLIAKKMNRSAHV